MVKYDVLKDSIAQAKQIGLEAIEAIKADQNSDLINIMKQMIDREF
jgi:hypothetical protein